MARPRNRVNRRVWLCRLSAELRAAVAVGAEVDGCSQAEWVERAVEEYLEELSHAVE